MFNANGGYLTEPHQAHCSVACMCLHIHKSNWHFAKKNCLFPHHDIRNGSLNFPTRI